MSLVDEDDDMMQTIVASGCQVSLSKKKSQQLQILLFSWRGTFMALPKTTEHDGQNMTQQWWQKHETQLPILAECPRRWLCVPASSSSSSERVFSAIRNIFSFKRAKLQPENDDKLLYIQQNYDKVNVQRWKLVSSDKGDQSVLSIDESGVTEPHLATPTPGTSYS